MTLTDRRQFLRRAGLSVAGLTALGGPLQGIFARGALAVGSTGVALNNGGYGTERLQHSPEVWLGDGLPIGKSGVDACVDP